MLSFFLQDVLDEIWDLIESVSEGFPTYPFIWEDFVELVEDSGAKVNTVKEISNEHLLKI